MTQTVNWQILLHYSGCWHTHLHLILNFHFCFNSKFSLSFLTLNFHLCFNFETCCITPAKTVFHLHSLSFFLLPHYPGCFFLSVVHFSCFLFSTHTHASFLFALLCSSWLCIAFALLLQALLFMFCCLFVWHLLLQSSLLRSLYTCLSGTSPVRHFPFWTFPSPALSPPSFPRLGLCSFLDPY